MIEPAPGPTVELAHPSGSRATLHLHGAHLTSWTPAGGVEAIFLSRAARFGAGQAIRGGVPVVWPQFSDTGPLPKHGFARTRPWRLRERAADGSAATLVLADDGETRALWPHPFHLALTVTLEERVVTLALEAANPGPESFRFTAALHSYLRVGEVTEARLEGVAGAPFRDAKADIGDPLARNPAPELRVGGPVDRLYPAVAAPVTLVDPVLGRRIVATMHGFEDLVVWNPWADGAAALPDLGDDEFREMLCIEAARVERPVELAPEARWRGWQRLAVEPFG